MKPAIFKDSDGVLRDVAPLAIRVQGFTLDIFGDHIQNREGRFSGVWHLAWSTMLNTLTCIYAACAYTHALLIKVDKKRGEK